MAKRKLKIRKAVTKSTWDNDAKEQISLEQGSAEYREYEDDLREVNPFQPDDEFHAKLEARNAVHDDILAVKAFNTSRIQTDAAHTNERRRMYKETRIAQMKDAVVKAAAVTPGTADDKRAARINEDSAFYESNIEYDNGVSEDGYIPQSLAKYL